MPETDDIKLLEQYARDNSEEAFAALVTRHVDLVYSVALRCVGNVHAAQEITQAVFIILSRKAGNFSRRTVLSGWLYQTSRLTAANYLRTTIRRRNREQEAFMQSTLNESESGAWPQIMPLLDDAMGRLGEKDRNAIVLRFFQNKNLSEVGAAIGVSEDAAKMRVNRALEKLHHYFNRRGVSSTTTILSGVISANSVQAAPAGLVISTVSAIKGSAATVSTMTLVKGTLKVMTYAKLKLALGIAAATLLTAGTLTVALSSGSDGTGSAGEASSQEKAFSVEIMQSLKDEDYRAFIADGETAFQKGVTALQFKAVCVQITPRLKAGYNVVFLGALKQQSYHVTLWKVACSDGGDDELLTLVVKNGKIGGAWIK